MTQEDKELLLLKDLSARYPYGVKIMYEGWDSDHGCEFNTVEELVGIDDRFIYTLWRGERDKHSIKEPFSITDYKPYLRPMSSMTEEERFEVEQIIYDVEVQDDFLSLLSSSIKRLSYAELLAVFDWLNAHHFDFRGLIEKGLAIEVNETNNPYK